MLRLVSATVAPWLSAHAKRCSLGHYRERSYAGPSSQSDPTSPGEMISSGEGCWRRRRLIGCALALLVVLRRFANVGWEAGVFAGSVWTLREQRPGPSFRSRPQPRDASLQRLDDKDGKIDKEPRIGGCKNLSRCALVGNQ